VCKIDRVPDNTAHKRLLEPFDNLEVVSAADSEIGEVASLESGTLKCRFVGWKREAAPTWKSRHAVW
jgi:hypothetical protein